MEPSSVHDQTLSAELNIHSHPVYRQALVGVLKLPVSKTQGPYEISWRHISNENTPTKTTSYLFNLLLNGSLPLLLSLSLSSVSSAVSPLLIRSLPAAWPA